MSLALRAGEIMAIAGVSGNGQQALADVLCGIARARRRTRSSSPGARLPRDPRAWIAAGVARIPEDRHAVGVDRRSAAVGERDRRALPHALRARRRGAPAARRSATRAHLSSASTCARARGIDTPARSLSGGNMQKLILGRALAGDRADGARAPLLIVADQPTWGLDIGAVAFVHQQLLDACARGAAVLLISDDLDEIFALADRIAVMHAGRLTGARAAQEWNLAAIGLAMAGAAQAEAAHAG